MSLFKFNTDQVSPEKWSEALEEVFSPLCGMDISLSNRAPKVEVDVCVLPGINVSNNRMDGHKAYRTYRHIADGDDSVLIAIPRTGELAVNFSGGITHHCQPGNVIVAAADKPFSAENQSFLHSSVIGVQREWFEDRFSDSHSFMNSLTAPANPEALRLLVRYIDTIVANGDEIGARAEKLSSVHLHELLTLALGGKAGPIPGGSDGEVRRARMQKIRQFMHSNMQKADLNAVSVAEACHVSPQYLRKMLRDSGTTFSEYLTGVRLDGVHKKLLNPASNNEAIYALAYSAGFNNLAWFNRAFRARFGMTPLEVRESAKC